MMKKILLYRLVSQISRLPYGHSHSSRGEGRGQFQYSLTSVKTLAIYLYDSVVFATNFTTTPSRAQCAVCSLVLVQQWGEEKLC